MPIGGTSGNVEWENRFLDVYENFSSVEILAGGSKSLMKYRSM